MNPRQWKDAEVEALLTLQSAGNSHSQIAEALAKQFNRRFTKDSVEKKIRRIRDNAGIPDVKAVDGEEKPLPTFEELVEQERLAAQKRQEARAVRREVQEQARWDNFCQTIVEAVRPLQFKLPPTSKPRAVSRQAEQAILNLSDCHFGKETAKYNMSIGEKRFIQLVDSVLDIITIHRQSYPVDVLNIFWEGDILDGEHIYKNQANYLDAHVVDQIFKMAPPIAAQLARLAAEFKQINNTCIRGNHGRVSFFSHDDSNFDRIFYKVLETATRNIPNITWNIPAGWHAVAKVFDTRFLIIHGNQIRMTLNLPWYGITTRVSRWASTEGVSAFDVVCMGHFHTSSMIRWNQKRVYTNGTFVSGDEFALEVLGLESSQSQWLFGVHPRRGTTWDYEIRFD